MCIFHFALTIVLCGEASHALKVLAEKGGIGEVHLVGYLGCTLVGVAQLYLYARDDGIVNPLLGGLAADLFHQCAQESRRITGTVPVSTFNLFIIS